MNIIGIDPSKVSTGMVINGKIFNYSSKSNAWNKTDLKKWYKAFSKSIEYRFMEYTKYNTYEEEQLAKLSDFDILSDMIIKDILENINPNEETFVAIEGYSYSSSAGPIIDLVTVSTLIRYKILKSVTKKIMVISPSTLKQEACKMTYLPIDIGKKVQKLEWRNNEGISGGAFNKNHMYLALLENKEFTDIPYIINLREHKEELSKMDIPKPIEDTNDAFLLYHYMKNITSYDIPHPILLQ